MERILSLIIGYLIGAINPAKIISLIKKQDLKESGTKNLGATNVMLHFGKVLGLIVMIFDIFKAFLSYNLAMVIFNELPVCGFYAGCGAVLGHVFPFYLKFKGGKGFATFGGIVLAYSWKLFIILLIIAVSLMLICNYTFAMPYSGSILFTVYAGIDSASIEVTCLTVLIGLFIMAMHFENLKAAVLGTDMQVRPFVKKMFTKKKEN